MQRRDGDIDDSAQVNYNLKLLNNFHKLFTKFFLATHENEC